jgi:hypothetical protein
MDNGLGAQVPQPLMLWFLKDHNTGLSIKFGLAVDISQNRAHAINEQFNGL